MKIKGEKTDYFQEYIGAPEYLMIEPTNVCNLKCITCSRETLKDIGSMDFNSFKYIIDMLPSVKTVKFHGLGEPLLAPDAFKMLDYLNQKNISTVIVSNLQWRNKDVEKLMCYLNHMYISIHSASKEGYESFSIGGKWELLIENIKKVVKYKTDKTDVVFNFVCTNKNVHEMVNVISLAAELGIIAVRFQIMQNWIADEQNNRHQEIKDLEINNIDTLVMWFRKARDKAEELGVDMEIVGNDEFNYNSCIWPFSRVYITWKGEVVPCCMRPDPEYSFGNILNTNFMQIWKNRHYRNLRTSLMEEKPLQMCTNCPYKVLAPVVKRVKNEMILSKEGEFR